MTRINCGISPRRLTNEHLLAEHREIKRIPNCISKGKYSMKGQPSEFTLGTGHVKFFYDKLGYLHTRYQELFKECIRRGFDVTNYEEAWNNVPAHLMGSYEPTDKDRQLIQDRILERLYAVYLKECEKHSGLACNMDPLCFESFKMAKTSQGKLLKQ